MTINEDEEIISNIQEILNINKILAESKVVDLRKELERKNSEIKYIEEKINAIKEYEDKGYVVKLQVYSGPTWSGAEQVCYYKIKAIATGIPEPDIKFSRDDSNGAFGKYIAQLKLGVGENYTLIVTATNSEGSAKDSMTFIWGE